MKKNFFKKLAFVLAAAMVIPSAIPAASGSAAAAPNFAKRQTNVYDGKSYSYTVKNVPKGGSVKWSVTGAGKSYVKLSKTTGKTVKVTVKTSGKAAAKNAAAKVQAKVYNKSKKLVKTVGDAVKVKISATAVSIGVQKDVDVKAIPVNESVKFSRKLTPSNATSLTYWTVTDKAGAATTAASIDTKGNFKAGLAGDYKVVATVKNAKTGKAITTAEQEVTVGDAITGAKQEALAKIAATFTSDVSKKVTKSDFKVTNDTLSGAEWQLKEVTFSTDGKTAYLVGYVNLINDSKYTVTYKDSKYELTAKAGAPVKSVISTAKVVINAEDPNLDIKYFDENGIDVTTDDLLSKTELEYSGAGYIDNAGVGSKDKTLIMYNVGDTTDVTAIYHTEKYTDGVEEVIKSEKITITAVAKDALTLQGFKSFTIAAKDAQSVSFEDKDVVKRLSTSDGDKRLYVQLKDSKDKTYSNADSEQADRFTFEATNENVLLVSSDGVLTAVKAGTSAVKVTYKDANDEKVTYTDLLTITVVGDRILASAKADSSSITTSTSKGLAAPTITIKAFDQFGDALEIESATVTTIKASPSDATEITVTENSKSTDFTKGKVVYDVGNVVSVGTYTVSVDIKAGSKTKTVSVKVYVKDGTAAASRRELVLSATSMDQLIKKDTEIADKAVTFTIKEFNKTGAQVAITSPEDYQVTLTTPDSDYDFKNVDGKTGITVSEAGIDLIKLSATHGAITVTVNTVVDMGGNVLKKLPAGSYTVKVTYGIDNKVVGTKRLVVRDGQPAPLYSLEKTTINSSDVSTVAELVKAAWKFEDSNDNDENVVDVSYKHNGQSVENGGGDTVEAGSYAITAIKYTQKIGDFTVTHTLKPGQTLTVKE